MVNRRLVSWIGNNDVFCMAADADTRTQKQVFKALHKKPFPLKGGTGPIRTLLNHEKFDEIHFLSNLPAGVARKYIKWVGVPAELHTVTLPSPTDYGAIFRVVDKVLRSLPVHDWDLSILLSPGTPAMAAIWVLLGKERYPATFYQTYEGGRSETEIPYSEIGDYLPQLPPGPDSNLAQLADRSPRQIKGFEDISGESKSIRFAVGRAAKASIRDINILLLGDSGTGKERFANAIHESSPRKGKGLFKAINCAAIPRELLESELFGHKGGAFTGSKGKDRDGLFRVCDGGTLFLDEIGECPLDLQAKLLRVLQPPPKKPSTHRVFRRVGDEEDLTANVRIVAATNRDPIKEIKAGTFREDLYYRLAVIEVQIPSLVERKSDLEVLANDLLEEINEELGSSEAAYTDKKLSPQAIRFIRGYEWPGNVRELRNALMQAAVMTDAEILKPADLKPGVTSMRRRGATSILERELGGNFLIDDVIDEVRTAYIERALSETRGVKKRAAELLGMENWQTMDGQMKRLDIDAARFKEK